MNEKLISLYEFRQISPHKLTFEIEFGPNAISSPIQTTYNLNNIVELSVSNKKIKLLKGSIDDKCGVYLTYLYI